MQTVRTLAKPELHLVDGQYQHYHTTALIINNILFYQTIIKIKHFFISYRSQSCNYEVHLSTHIPSHLIEYVIAIHLNLLANSPPPTSPPLHKLHAKIHISVVYEI